MKIVSYPNNEPEREGIVCIKCQYTYFADIYDYPDPVTFVCAGCKDKEEAIKSDAIEQPKVPQYVSGYNRR